jgi:Flp pilus assembly protein TadD
MNRAVCFLLCAAAAGQTFYKDIAPITNEYCAPCHRPGDAAPFSLLEYSDVKGRARQIAEVTRSRYMPPWPPERGKGDFAGERRLSEAQLKALEAWAAVGAPEGDAKDAPPKPKFVEGWQLGQPDLVVTLDRPYTLAASGSDVFRNFVLRVPLDLTRYVRAAEIRPGNKRIVHHANVLIDRAGSSRLRDRKDGAPGFSGMDVRIETQTFDPDTHFLFWKPGTVYTEEPPDMAWRIDPGTDLILNMHLQPSGKPESLQPSVGLYFTNQAPSRIPMLIQLEHDGAIDIPPGRRDFVVRDQLRLPVDVDVLGVYPHAHYLGKDLQAWATLPDGTRRWLIRIPDWDINWQAVYRYRKPLSLPGGTLIEMHYTYDNSAANPRNPSRPPVRVVNGDRSVDEMAHLWLQVLPRATGKVDGRIVVQEAVLRRRLEKYPSDFFAQYSLGAMEQTRGNLDAAASWYKRALAADPRSATAHNAMGTLLQQRGKAAEAAVEFETAIRIDRDYGDAHYNLARIQLAAERFEEAIRHLRETVRIDPQDAAAMSDLGAALHATGSADEGIRYLRRAARLRPDLFNARYNLGQALAASGKLAEAEAELREALKLNAGDADTLDALARIHKRK